MREAMLDIRLVAAGIIVCKLSGKTRRKAGLKMRSLTSGLTRGVSYHITISYTINRDVRGACVCMCMLHNVMCVHMCVVPCQK